LEHTLCPLRAATRWQIILAAAMSRDVSYALCILTSPSIGYHPLSTPSIVSFGAAAKCISHGDNAAAINGNELPNEIRTSA